MNLIGAGLEADVDDRTGLPAKFRWREFFDIEFLDRIDRQNGRRIACDAGSIDDGLARVGLAVEQSFNEISIVFRAQAIRAGGRESSAGIANHAGTKLEQVLVVAPIQWKIVDLRIAQGAAQGGRGTINERNLVGNHDRLGNLASRQREVDPHILCNLDRDVGALYALESLGLGSHFVNAGLQFGGNIITRRIGGHGAGRAALHIGYSNGRSRHRGAGLIADTT